MGDLFLILILALSAAGTCSGHRCRALTERFLGGSGGRGVWPNLPARKPSKQPYEFIGFGALDVTKPYEFIGSGALYVTKPYDFIGSGAMDITKPYEFKLFFGGAYCSDGGLIPMGGRVMHNPVHAPGCP